MDRAWRTVVDRIERTASRLGRDQSRRCSIEGLRLHERALRAGVPIEAVVLSRGLREDIAPRPSRLLDELEVAGSELHVVPDDVIAALTRGRRLGDIVGLLPLPAPARLDDVCARRIPTHSVFLAACDVEEPGNTGALIRTALAGGAAGFVAVGQTDPWHPKALRTSMGSIFKIPLLAAKCAEAFVAEMQNLGGATYAAVSRDGVPLPRLNLEASPLAFLLGGESIGLSPMTVQATDGQVSIPMAAGIDSFSVNAAAAILLYEAVGRRPS